MKYMLMICGAQALEVGQEGSSVEPWLDEMDRRGVRLYGERLRPASDATTVRVRDGELLVDDGPFAETKVQIEAYDVIEATDLEEAIEVASKHPVAKFGTIELRPLWQMAHESGYGKQCHCSGSPLVP